MPRRNRVTPFGDIVADAGRGMLMGNRGVLHDAEQRIVRDSQVRRWIACRLEFRGRWRPTMQPGHWTELFFLDEAAAFAAGHRPCAECRHADYLRFKQAWCQAVADARDPTPSADAIDRRLHAERRLGPWRKRTYTADIATLPDGTYVALNGRAWLVQSESLLEWSAGGYLGRHPRVSRGDVTVLTPPTLVAAIAAGYGPSVHPSSRS